jgi:hypothetical protein
VGKQSGIDSSISTAEDGIEKLSVSLLGLATEQLVPWEIVTAPLPFARYGRLLPLVARLRNAGAKGTRYALRYAFGLHLNPEVPDFRATTLLSHLRAYVCLYDWIVHHEQTDFARRLTPHIQHYDKGYIQRLLEPDYAPTLGALMDDYLRYNPTRNRSLDMLPLFAYLDEERVWRVVDDPRIKPRPTFHYRLPNCDIDNPAWNIDKPLALWLQVEALAADPVRLRHACAAYRLELARLTHVFEDRWLHRVPEFLGVDS